MRKWLSALVVVLGLLHVLSVVLVDGPQLLDLARGGLGALPDAPDRQRAAFYSVLFGVLAAAAGQLMFWTASRFGEVPVTPGVVLVLVGLVGALGAPRSPFWAALFLGVAVVIVSRLPPDQVTYRRRRGDRPRRLARESS